MEKKITVGFTGDLSFSGYFAGRQNDDDVLDGSIKEFLNANDWNVINFESPVTPSRITKKKRLAHRCGGDALDFVSRNIKNPVLSFANNHMMDFGYIGVVDTLDACRERALPCVGIGLDIEEACRYTVLGDGIKVGILAIEYKKYLVAGEANGGPLHESKTEYIKKKLRSMKENVDYAVVVYHGGDEFLHAPMPYIRRQLRRYLSWGADAVVAHHPHVVQGYEYFGGKPVFYSLGNFIFDTDYQRVQEDTENGMLLRLTFTEQGISFDCLPTHIDRENHTVSAGDDMRYFTEQGGDKFRCLEACRKLDVKARANKLKEEELALRTERMESERARIEALQLRADIREAELSGAEPEPEEQQDEENTETGTEEVREKKKSLHSVLKKVYKRVVVKRQDNIRAAEIRLCRLRARTIYR
ncbi:MAG: CapA family protein [Oscillospiraceae bacterium]|nr:CapA family protein [Oscillospiraceae bacterium]